MHGDFMILDVVARLGARAFMVAYLPVLGLASLLLIFGWRGANRPAFQYAWGAACLFAAIATLLFALRGIVPDIVVILGANCAWMTAWASLWAGARHLRQWRAPLWLVLAPAMLWVLLSLTVPGFFHSMPLRQMLLFCLCTPICLAQAWTMLGYRRQDKPSRGASISAWLTLGYVLTTMALTATGYSPSFSGLGTMLIGTEFVSIAFIGLVIAHEHVVDADAARLAMAQLRETGLRAELAEREAVQLRHVQAEITRLLGGLPLGIFLRRVAQDGTHTTIFAGGEIEMISGWPRSVLADQTALTARLEPGTPPRQEAMARAVREGGLVEDWQLRQPDGSWRWIRTQLRCLATYPDGSGDVVGYIQNISRERMAEAQAQRAGRLASLGEMATGLAHELNQPLAAISLMAENAARQIGEDKLDRAQERLEKVIIQTQRASDIIAHLRAFAASCEDQSIPTSTVKLEEAVQGALLLTRYALQEASAEIVLDLGSPPPILVADRIGLERVLVTLLSNARDSLLTTPTTTHRRVRIAAERDGAAGEDVTITVSDTGGGIPELVMQRIFEPFVTTKAPNRGGGLGLSTAFGLIKAMDGTLHAENRDGGAVFTIRLKAAMPEG
ncbi:MAG: ATP-binding protein [Acetobacteraceae bacterium]|nr:ATP-binding protein [Acetobacteraceae bacterium]